MPFTRTIVVADDEPHVRHILDLKLRTAGYEIHVACDGEEARDLALKHQPDLVITDYEMPGLTGDLMGAALQADARTAGTPLIMLTARGHRLPTELLKQANVIMLMDKPFSVNALLREIDAYFSDALNKPVQAEHAA